MSDYNKMQGYLATFEALDRIATETSVWTPPRRCHLHPVGGAALVRDRFRALDLPRGPTAVFPDLLILNFLVHLVLRFNASRATYKIHLPSKPAALPGAVG